MKSKIYIKGLASVMALGMLASCSSDYLQVEPVTVISSATVQTTQEGAQAALYGLCSAMYTPYSNYSESLQPNGEGSIMIFYGEVMGQDYYSYFWSYRAPFVMTMDRFRDNQTWMCNIPWGYCYNLIGQANNILEGIDNIDGDKDRLNFIKAQALTIRSHAYFRLLQIYAPRWEDSHNGETLALVKRIKPGTEELPLSSMNEIIKLIYDDLDTAIELFESSGVYRNYLWEPDEDVARGIYSRTALLKQDFQTAEVMAHDARKGGRNYKVMTADQYKAGFAIANSEWMWSNSPEYQLCAYWSNGAYYACNGAYVDWDNGAGAINYELYRQIPEGDIRADLFFTPDKLTGGLISSSAFWNSGIVNPASMGLSKNVNMKNEYRTFGNSVIPPTQNNITFTKPYVSTQAGNAECEVMFGSQYKFWAIDAYGTCAIPFMRGSEMLLNEAEAACHNGHYDVAKNLLLELNAQRNPNYTCNKTGDALLEEVILQRRIELWGEGFNWFDLKRWNLPLVRNIWEAGNVNSNNIPAAYRLNMDPTDQKGWRWIIPLRETQYNSMINPSDLE